MKNKLFLLILMTILSITGCSLKSRTSKEIVPDTITTVHSSELEETVNLDKNKEEKLSSANLKDISKEDLTNVFNQYESMLIESDYDLEDDEYVLCMIPYVYECDEPLDKEQQISLFGEYANVSDYGIQINYFTDGSYEYISGYSITNYYLLDGTQLKVSASETENSISLFIDPNGQQYTLSKLSYSAGDESETNYGFVTVKKMQE